MILDVASELRAVLEAAGLSPERLDERLERAVERALARRETDRLLPLAAILSISPRAALARLSRDPELRGLGHRLGRRLTFRRSEVEHLLAERQRERSSR